MSEPVIIALITNATVIIVAGIQALMHRKHEKIGKKTLTAVQKLNGHSDET